MIASLIAALHHHPFHYPHYLRLHNIKSLLVLYNTNDFPSFLLFSKWFLSGDRVLHPAPTNASVSASHLAHCLNLLLSLMGRQSVTLAVRLSSVYTNDLPKLIYCSLMSLVYLQPLSAS